MKLEENECVKIKRRAQTRIYEETKDLTPEALVAHYRSTAAARQRQAELRAHPQPASPSAAVMASDTPQGGWTILQRQPASVCQELNSASAFMGGPPPWPKLRKKC